MTALFKINNVHSHLLYLYLSRNKCGKLGSPRLTRMKSQAVIFTKKNVFDYILFHQLVLEIYDLGKSLFLLT